MLIKKVKKMVTRVFVAASFAAFFISSAVAATPTPAPSTSSGSGATGIYVFDILGNVKTLFIWIAENLGQIIIVSGIMQLGMSKLRHNDGASMNDALNWLLAGGIMASAQGILTFLGF